MQKWCEVGPGKYESECARAELHAAPKRLLVTFTGPIEPAEAVGLIRAAGLDLNQECMVAIATGGREELVRKLRGPLRLGPEIGGEVAVIAIPAIWRQ